MPLKRSRAIIPATIRETRSHPSGAATLASFQTQQQGMLMSITLSDSRALLRLALASIALALGLGRAAIASEVTTPVEQLHAGLMAIMKAGKTAPFRQRYDMIAPVIGRR